MRDITRELTLDDQLSTPSGKRLPGEIRLGPDFRIQRDDIKPHAIRNAFRVGGANREIAASLQVGPHQAFEIRTAARVAHRARPATSHPSAMPTISAAAM